MISGLDSPYSVSIFVDHYLISFLVMPHFFTACNYHHGSCIISPSFSPCYTYTHLAKDPFRYIFSIALFAFTGMSYGRSLRLTVLLNLTRRCIFLSSEKYGLLNLDNNSLGQSWPFERRSKNKYVLSCIFSKHLV